MTKAENKGRDNREFIGDEFQYAYGLVGPKPDCSDYEVQCNCCDCDTTLPRCRRGSTGQSVWPHFYEGIKARGMACPIKYPTRCSAALHRVAVQRRLLRSRFRRLSMDRWRLCAIVSFLLATLYLSVCGTGGN